MRANGHQVETVVQPFNKMARQHNLQHFLLNSQNTISDPAVFNSCLSAIIYGIAWSRILGPGLAYPAGIHYLPLSIQGDHPFFSKLYEIKEAGGSGPLGKTGFLPNSRCLPQNLDPIDIPKLGRRLQCTNVNGPDLVTNGKQHK